MTIYDKNGTAHTTSFLTKQEVSDKEVSKFQTKLTKQSMKGNQDYFGKSILSDYAPVAQNLAEEYENLDNDYVLEIVKLFSTFTDRETSDTNFDVCRVALDASIKPDEVYLMETMFENNLESLSKDGIKIFEIDGCLDIRNKGVQKHLSHEDREKIEEHLVGVDSNDSDFDVSGVGFDPSTGNHGYSIITSGGGATKIQEMKGEVKEVTMDFEQHDGEFLVSASHDY